MRSPFASGKHFSSAGPCRLKVHLHGLLLHSRLFYLHKFLCISASTSLTPAVVSPAPPITLWVQVIDDLRDECAKFGAVLEVKVPRPPNPALAPQLFGTNNYGKVRDRELIMDVVLAAAAVMICSKSGWHAYMLFSRQGQG